MLFNSVAFFIFLTLVFLVYWKVLANKLRAQNFFVLIASYVFYGWWDWRFLILIFISSIIDYLAGLQIHANRENNRRKIWFGLSLTVNLGLLCFFKYFDFFVDSFITAFSGFGIQLHEPSLNVILPVGISFYTFQTLSYSIDIYRRKFEPTRDPVAFFTFVAFFPQLVAGPIERASHLLPQFLRNRVFNEAFAISGLRIMLWGFFKKVVISDNLAPVVDSVFNHAADVDGIQVWLGAILFTIQVYCDFSGYSDIAIGCGRLFGFDIMTNFRTPFFSKTIAELWNRWHISLNTWFRDYVYFPLGGNRVSQLRWSFNILAVFALSGLWHGTNWTYILWGIFNALYLLYARYTERFRNTINNTIGLRNGTPVKNVMDATTVFLLFCFSCIFFRSNHVDDLFTLLVNGFNGSWEHFTHIDLAIQAVAVLFTSIEQMMMVFASIVILFLVDLMIREDDVSLALKRRNAAFRWSFYFFIAGWTALFGAFARPENFIYFQF